MLCRKPILVNRNKFFKKRPDIAHALVDELPSVPVPCGQCLACRINKRRQWTTRLLLEFINHDKTAFVTLTYSPENLVFASDDFCHPEGVLEKRHIQLFLKSLRKRFSDRRIRFYACGEYGPNGTHRPHYHLILFGVSAEELDPDWFYFAGKSGPCKPNYCRNTPLFSIWKKGIVHVGEVTPDSIAYVAGYVTSKITRKGDGRRPEFNLMSRMPGLGLAAITDLARHLQKVSESSGQPITARKISLDGRYWPLGRYILQVLRRISDIRDGTEEYTAVVVDAFRTAQQQGIDFLTYLVESDNQRYANLEKRQQLFRKRKNL